MSPEELAFMGAYVALITAPVIFTVGLVMLVELAMRAAK